MRNKWKEIVIWLRLVAILLVAAFAARAGQFRVVGPGGGGAMFHPTISPHDSREVLVACDMTGSYISHDGGNSWRMFNLRGAVRFFAFDPQHPHVIYAATTGLWRSTNDGESWNLIWPKPATVQGIRMNTDHADETFLSSANPLGEIVALAIDPSDSQALLIGAVRKGKAALFFSKDGGDNWKIERELSEVPRKIWIDPDSGGESRDIYIAMDSGFTLRDHGIWLDRPAPAGVHFVSASAGFSSQGPILYAASETGLFSSKDRGHSWISGHLPGIGGHFRAVATSLKHPELAYASYSRLQLDGKSWLGIARTRDNGNTWTLVWKEERVAAPNVHDAWITQSLGTDWGENPLNLGVADQDSSLCYATDLGRTMMTADAGTTWHATYSQRQANGDWTSTGLDVTTNYGYFFDPFNTRRRFIPTTDIGLFRSEDNGRSWTRSMTGVPDAWSNTAYWVIFDPATQGKLWGVMSGTHDLPRPKMWRHNSVTSYKGGICLSLDGGRTWKPSNKGMPETAPTHILLDPGSPVGRRTLWVATMGRGVYKSTDDGVTWVSKNKGILQNEPLAWRLARANDGTLYVLIARRSEDGSVGTSGDGAVYKSTDGGDSWSPVKMPAVANAPNGLAIDPEDVNRLYLATWARASGTNGIGGGIFISADAGKSWKSVLNSDQHIYDVTIDPQNTNILYAAGFQSSAWRSSDRGEHWSRIHGFNFKWAHRVMPDLEDTKKIYITTFGGGVWHGPANGVEDREDIATPKLQPGR